MKYKIEVLFAAIAILMIACSTYAQDASNSPLRDSPKKKTEKKAKVTPEEQIRPQRFLTGDDLQAMGFQPGPLFSRILGALEEAQLEGQISTREEAEELVRDKFGSKQRRVPRN